MKKIILILTLLPSFFFGQCFISEMDLVGVELNFDNLGPINLKSNNQIYEKGKKTNGSWSYDKNEKILKIKTSWNWSYYYDLKSGLNNSYEIKKTWSEDSEGNATKSGIKGWKSFDKNFYHLLVDSYSECIKNYINQKITIWEKKGEFEKTVDFQKRVNDNSRKKEVEKLKKEAIGIFKKEIINNINSSDLVLKEYNADNETFLFVIADFEPINFPVPISKAENFKKNFNPSTFSNLDFIFANDKFIVSNITVDSFTYNLFSND